MAFNRLIQSHRSMDIPFLLARMWQTTVNIQLVPSQVKMLIRLQGCFQACCLYSKKAASKGHLEILLVQGKSNMI